MKLELMAAAVIIFAVYMVCTKTDMLLPGDTRFVRQGVVVDVGSCGGGEGFFSGNYECAVKVKIQDEIEFINIYGQAIIGQPVYKHCWTKEGNSKCYSTARKYIRNGWR